MDFLLVLAVVIVAAVVARVVGAERERRRLRAAREAEQLAAVRRAADEDVTGFGEELQQLGDDLAGRDLDEGARSDYQRALDAYEDAKQAVGAVTEPDEVRHVTEILEDGRYAMACVRARVEGEPLPQRRPPCFFNPQHGPSVTDVRWAPPGGVERDVPACALDAERVEAGAEPDSRQVLVGPRRMPYWQAGPAFAPWTAGYFGAYGGLMPGLLVGTVVGGVLFAGQPGYENVGADGSVDASGGDAGGDGGGYDGGESGGWDSGGGWDGGGGFDAGGFDGGGF